MKARHHRGHMRVALLLLMLPLAGCLAEPESSPDPVAPGAPPLGASTIVAVIDTGINVYHDHFQGSVPAHVLERIRMDTDVITVAPTMEGDYDARVEADEELWSSMTQGQVYHFEGTRILGISFGSQVPVLDDNGSSHGTATAAAVLDANPGAVVIMVEGLGNADAEQWSATQPWIDFLSESYGPLGSPPTWVVAGSSTAEANKVAWDNGKLPFGAADNSPALSPVDSTAGPPWVVGIAGAHPESNCREPMSGNVPDFTADWTQELPQAYSVDEYRTVSGTSFATPLSAGVASAVLQQVREAWGHTGGITDGWMALGPEGGLDKVGLRDALNHTARYFEETCSDGEPVPPEGPWVSQGWGNIEAGIIEATVGHILGDEAPDKPDAAVQYMEAVYEERKATWGEP